MVIYTYFEIIYHYYFIKNMLLNASTFTLWIGNNLSKILVVYEKKTD